MRALARTAFRTPGPPALTLPGGSVRLAVFGPEADNWCLAKSIGLAKLIAETLVLIGISSDVPWGKASSELVNAVFEQHVVAIIALDRNSSHLAEQIGVKAFVPVLAISSDHALTSTNIPWIFRLPEGTSLDQAMQTVAAAESSRGPNRSRLRDVLASGTQVAGTQFQPTGEPR